MTIIYEPGDVVEVDDNSDVGPMAGNRVELIQKVGTVWNVITVGCWKHRAGIIGSVEETYIIPY